ncbi:MAG: cyclase family protein [Treponema sp.]|nr:cyclase family protein [Treponema sp.]
MKAVDLTLSIYEGMPCFPVSWYPKPVFEHVLTPDNDVTNSHRYASKTLLFCHGGTHLDSPMHFNYFDCKKTIDKVPVDVLVGQTVWVHLPDKKNLEPITRADLEEATKGLTLKDKRLLITTGYTDKNWGKEDYFQVSPYLTGESAEWMLGKEICMVAIDFQTDKPGDAAFPVHNTLLSKEVYILEYINNVDKLIKEGFGKEFLMVVGALKLENLEASTARVFGIQL